MPTFIIPPHLERDWDEAQLLAHHLYPVAEHARNTALSYRGFKVGCALLGHYDRGARKIFAGMNMKVLGDSRTICAEAIALGSAIGFGCTSVIAIMVVGHPQEENPTKTLHPCKECRTMMRHSQVVEPTTPILTALPGQSTHDYDPGQSYWNERLGRRMRYGEQLSFNELQFEHHTFAELSARYDEGE